MMTASPIVYYVLQNAPFLTYRISSILIRNSLEKSWTISLVYLSTLHRYLIKLTHSICM